MRRRLGPLLAALIVAEIVVFILVGNSIGFGWTILLALVTSVIGLWLFGREGIRALQALGQGPRGTSKGPAQAVVDTGLVAVGGLLILMPGFVSDVVGLLCLIPFTRPMMRALVIGGVVRKYGPAHVRSRRVDGVGAPAPGASGPLHSPADRVTDPGTTRPTGRRDEHEVIEGEIIE